jgi:hypothetical protein
MKQLTDNIIKVHPNVAYSVYGEQRVLANSLAVSYFLNHSHRENKQGEPIGITYENSLHQYSLSSGYGMSVYKLTVRDLNNHKWVPRNQSDVYDDLVVWLELHKLRSTFNLISYLRNFIKLRG